MLLATGREIPAGSRALRLACLDLASEIEMTTTDQWSKRIRAVRHDGEPCWRRPYERARDLPRLVPLLGHELDAACPASQTRLVALLHRALRAERARALQAHSTYDPARHAALMRAWSSEARLLRTRGGSAARIAGPGP